MTRIWHSWLKHGLQRWVTYFIFDMASMQKQTQAVDDELLFLVMCPTNYIMSLLDPLVHSWGVRELAWHTWFTFLQTIRHTIQLSVLCLGHTEHSGGGGHYKVTLLNNVDLLIVFTVQDLANGHVLVQNLPLRPDTGHLRWLLVTNSVC